MKTRPRNPRGWGSISPHPSGYRASINIGRRRERKLFPTAELARAWLKALRPRKVAVEAGAAEVPGLAEWVRFRDLEDGFAKRLKLGFRRVPTDRTRDSYRGEVADVLKWWGPRIVAATTERDVTAYVQALRGRELSTSAIRHRLDRLSQLVRFAVEQRYITREPCRIRRPGLVQASRGAIVTDAQVAAMEAAADPLARAIILLAADAGLRRDEIRRFQSGDVYRDHIHVAVRSEGERTKSGKGRDVPILTDRLRDALRRAPWGLWPSTPWKVATAASAAWRSAGLPGRARLHAARHRWITALLAGRVPLVKVQEWAGHSTPTVTMRYAHLDPLDVPEAAYAALLGHLRATKVSRGNVGMGAKSRKH